MFAARITVPHFSVSAPAIAEIVFGDRLHGVLSKKSKGRTRSQLMDFKFAMLASRWH